MEIYKLSDNVPDGLTKKHKRDIMAGKASQDVGVSGGDDNVNSNLVITNLKQGVKNPNRVNVFVNEKYAFSLDVAQVVDYKLKVGLRVSAERLAELKRASEFGKLYQRTLEWVLVRPRSVRETRDYLRKKRWNVLRGHFATNEEQVSEGSPVTTGRAERVREEYSEFFEQILERLESRGYLDDRKFAEYYVENRFVKKGVSQMRLRMELMKKGVSRDIIDEVLNERDDEEEIRKMIARKRTKYDDEKLTAYLCRQGFSYDLVQKIIQETEED